jgi:hypothetical protein
MKNIQIIIKKKLNYKVNKDIENLFNDIFNDINDIKHNDNKLNILSLQNYIGLILTYINDFKYIIIIIIIIFIYIYYNT